MEEEYETIFDQRNFLYDPIKSALNVVFEFIKSKDLVLYGGMSQDLVLQSKGHPGIYSEHKLPDFDMFSPNSFDHSNELAVILMKKGFTEISAINALHATTRRTRVLFTPVADISYMPEAVFKNLETIRVIHGPYKGIRIIHFIYIYIDFLRFYVYSFENAPLEPIQERFNKISKRFRLIIDNCPLEFHKYDTPPLLSLDKSEVENGLLTSNHLIHGIDAYFLYFDYFQKTYGETFNFNFFKDRELGKKAFYKTVIGDFAHLYEEAKLKGKIFNPFLDIQPLTFLIDNVEYWDNSEKPIIYNKFEDLNLDPKSFGPSVDGIICIYGVFLYFLRKCIATSDEDMKNLCKHIALSVQNMITIAETEFLKNLPNDPELKKKSYDKNPFFFHVKLYGKRNELVIESLEKKRAELNDDQYVSDLPEFGFYPEGFDEDHLEYPKFSYEKSIKFAIDGLERSKDLL